MLFNYKCLNSSLDLCDYKSESFLKYVLSGNFVKTNLLKTSTIKIN